MSFFVDKVDDGYGGFLYNPTTAGFTALVIIMVVLFLLGCFIFGSNKKNFDARKLAFSAVAIGLAFGLSFVKVLKMPFGGTVTLFSMLFVTLVGYWYGIGAGLAAATAYGILQLVQDPYIISLPQMLVDYIFAFAALGLSGIFSRTKKFSLDLILHTGKKDYKLTIPSIVPAYLIAVIGRYFFAFISGWIFFGMYMPDFFTSAVVYSLTYNILYLGLEALITVIVLCIPPVYKGIGIVSNWANPEKPKEKAETK